MATDSRTAGRVPPAPQQRKPKRPPGRYPVHGWETVNEDGARLLLLEDNSEWVMLPAAAFLTALWGFVAFVIGLATGLLLGSRFL